MKYYALSWECAALALVLVLAAGCDCNGSLYGERVQVQDYVNGEKTDGSAPTVTLFVNDDGSGKHSTLGEDSQPLTVSVDFNDLKSSLLFVVGIAEDKQGIKEAATIGRETIQRGCGRVASPTKEVVNSWDAEAAGYGVTRFLAPLRI